MVARCPLFYIRSSPSVLCRIRGENLIKLLAVLCSSHLDLRPQRRTWASRASLHFISSESVLLPVSRDQSGLSSFGNRGRGIR